MIEGNQSRAQELAHQSALRKAISQAIESEIQKGTKEELQYQVKKVGLLKEPYPYLMTQKVIESGMEGKLLTVSLEIQVDSEALTRFLGQQGILAERMEEQKRKEWPMIMVLVGEEINGKEHRPSFCGTMLTKTLLGEGFSLVDEEAIQRSIQHDQAVQSLLRGNQKAAAAMALQYGAGIVISGRAVVTKSGLKSGPMQVHGANVTLQALHSDSGEIFASAIGDGFYPHVNMITGSQKAVEEATQKALKSLLEDFQRQLETSASTLLVSISGITYGQLAYLKKILRENSRFPNLTDIQQKSFQGQVAKLQFTITNSPQEFTDRLATYDFQKFALNVLSYSPRKVDFALNLKPFSSR
ncbi:hypothetical protein [Candidatus Nitrospira neomarina]|uniref:Uncharacterized protein n=1 Tax=Candidatus Nitrospira neomarina TaxID=3020899 RepID=A0AA96K506_9BACT|nr:hypothetical protein [Candidatus Nitrospira neomarina]WNM63914.1 hypothetical protein PQG83_09195 [Candidatus Nitrospira neomarina]